MLERFYSIMRKLIVLFISVPFLMCAQGRREHPKCDSKAFDKTLESLLSFTIPTIGCKELNDTRRKHYVLDARERHEFDVSHLSGARHVGYDDFKYDDVQDIPKNASIVVYCSVGYRSEKIGEKLKLAGFTNVKNLYGSIFEWVNQGYKVVNNFEQPVLKVHSYNATWGQWISNKNIEKIYK